jgi:hypothetical protein
MVLSRETRAIASEWISAARLRLTSEAICWAVCSVRGSNSSARSSGWQALPAVLDWSRRRDDDD